MDRPIEFQHGKDAGWHFYHRPLGLMLIIVYKALWGLGELSVGVAIFFSSQLIAGELIEDPQDLFTHWLLSHFSSYLTHATLIGAIVAGSGIIKLILAIGLWYRSFLIRNLAIIFFGVIGLYGLYSVIHQYSFTTLLAVIGDLLILYYLWKVLPKHLKHNGIS
jgi:uncharacterized membrane protein